MAIKYTANVIRQIKSGATTYDLQDATLKPFVEQLLSDVASIKGVYTEEQANAHNAGLDGALPNTGEATFTAEQATAYNNAITGANVQEGNTITPEQANLYNGTLQGAVEAGDERNDDSATSVKSLSENLTTLEGRVTTVEGNVTTLGATVEEHARVTAASLTELDSRVDAIEGVNVTTEDKAAWTAKYDKPSTGIPANDLAAAVQTSLGKADNSVQTVAVAGGTNNGTIKLTVNGTATDNIAVTGLGSAAYTDTTAYATAAQGALADSAVKSVAEGATNGTIAVDGTDVAVHGLGSAAYTASTAYDAAGAAAAVLGTAGDAANANTVYGAKAAAAAAAADAAAVLGASTDGTSANTVYGAKAYAKDLVDKILGEDSASTTLESLKQVIQELNAPENQDGITGTFIDTVKSDLAGLTKTVNNEQVHATVKEYVDNAVSNASSSASSAIAALDATPSQTAGADGLALSLTQVDGVVTGISGSIAANTYDAHGAAATAQAAAEATAAADATSKANAAQAAAISAAANDATTKANAAEANAKSYADTKVGTLPQGYSDVISYVDGKTSVDNGILTL